MEHRIMLDLSGAETLFLTACISIYASSEKGDEDALIQALRTARRLDPDDRRALICRMNRLVKAVMEDHTFQENPDEPR